jgi:hypothetical protein
MRILTVSPQMASRSSTRIQAWNRMLNDHGIRVQQNVTHHKSQDLLAFMHGRVHTGITQLCEKTLQVLRQLHVSLFIDKYLYSLR